MEAGILWSCRVVDERRVGLEYFSRLIRCKIFLEHLWRLTRCLEYFWNTFRDWQSIKYNIFGVFSRLDKVTNIFETSLEADEVFRIFLDYFSRLTEYKI